MPGSATVRTVQLADGPGLPVVCSYALGLDHRMWARWAERQKGQRPVLAYDHRGHGRRDAPTAAQGEPFTMQHLVDDAAAVVEAWGQGPVAWLGLSLGGMVGQGLALQHPQLLQGLILANTTSVYPDAARAAWAQRIDAVRQGGMAAVVDAVVQRYLHDAFRQTHPGIVAQMRATLLDNDPTAYAQACAAVAGVDWHDALPGIRCPTLVLAGALDQGTTPAMAQAIASRIPAARSVVLQQASHLSVAEQPEAFDAVVGEFLNELDASRRTEP